MSSSLPVGLITVLVLQGCSSGLPTDFGPSEPVYGTQLAPSFFIIRPAWSSSGDEVFFYQSWEGKFYSVSVASGEVVALGSVSGRPAGRSNMRTGYGGSHVYGTVTMEGPCDAIYAVPTAGGEPELVIQGLAWPWFAVSRDETRFAVIRRCASGGFNSVAVFDRPSGKLLPVTLGIDGWALLSLSADGQQLVYGAVPRSYSSAASELHLRDLASRSELTLLVSPPRDGSVTIGNVQWRGAQPQLIIAEREAEASQFDIAVVDFTHNAQRPYGSVPAGDASAGGVWAVTWHSDGAAAVWTPVAVGPQVCSPDGVCISRQWIHWRVYLLPGPQAPVQLIAEMVSSEGPGWLEFSPNGAYLGYVLEGELFVLPMQ